MRGLNSYEEDYTRKRAKKDSASFRQQINIKRNGKTIKVDGDDKERLDYEMRRSTNNWKRRSFLT